MLTHFTVCSETYPVTIYIFSGVQIDTNISQYEPALYHCGNAVCQHAQCSQHIVFLLAV